MTVWSDERVAKLRELWLQALSAREIANELGNGLSRNAVIGKVHRLGLPGRMACVRPKAPAAPIAKRKLAPQEAPAVNPGESGMRRVVLESPYAGNVPVNLAYARACVCDCLMRGEAPIASHLLYTQDGIFRDDIPVERTQGIAAGHAWIAVADAIIVYVDLGVSNGMMAGMEIAKALGKPIETRSLPAWLMPRSAL